MRLFVAVRPSSAAVAHLSDALTRLTGGRQISDVRWIPADRWHVTVSFLGEVPEPQIADVTRRLTRVAQRSGAGTLRLNGSGHFGRQALYLRLSGDVELLARLAQAAAAAAKRAGISVEDRRFRAHLTVARGRGGADLKTCSAALAHYDGPAWPLDRFALIRSQLGPAPRYTDVVSWPLSRTSVDDSAAH